MHTRTYTHIRHECEMGGRREESRRETFAINISKRHFPSLSGNEEDKMKEKKRKERRKKVDNATFPWLE